MEFCKTLVVCVDDHLRELTKMIALTKGSFIAKFTTLHKC